MIVNNIISLETLRILTFELKIVFKYLFLNL